MKQRLKKSLAPFKDVPILFISAKEKTRIFKAIETALEVYETGNERFQLHSSMM
jgi:GTP-binding protein